MPRADELPEDLRALARRNAAPLTHDRFGADVGKLVVSVRKAIAHEAERCEREAQRKRAEEEATARRRAEEEAERKRVEEEAVARSRKRAEEEAKLKRAEEAEAARKRAEQDVERERAEAEAANEQARKVAEGPQAGETPSQVSAGPDHSIPDAEDSRIVDAQVPPSGGLETPERRGDVHPVSRDRGVVDAERPGIGKSSAIRLPGWVKVALPATAIAPLVAVLVTVSAKGPKYPEMVVIPAGTFQMGSPHGEGEDDERPRHEVRIDQSFAIGRTEVTFTQWDTCAQAGACSHNPVDERWGRGDRPVINVSWKDAREYAAWLSEKTGKSYRLPTEAEWEYAARAGTDTAWSFGDDGGDLAEHAWYGANSGARTHPVGGKEPNAWGLYDVHGNVWEWVQDCWNADYVDAPPEDGLAWESADCARRVVRGGSWGGGPGGLRSAGRYGFDAGIQFNSIGFRLAQDL